MISYFLVRFFGYCISWMPYRMLHGLGRALGSIVFWCYRPLRKKAMTNLAIAFGEERSEKERRLIARRSFQNLMITLLEFFKIKPRHLSSLIQMQDPEKVTSLQEKGQGIVFLTGHQANWEFPFLAINMLSPGGVAVGRPIKNRRLYQWILSIRQMNGGRIIVPKQAIKEGLRALKHGKYIGIVGDQALPESDYSYPLFGTRTWISPAPALLAYRTHSPIIVGTIKRTKGSYTLSGSDPIWPNPEQPMKEAIPHMMDQAMAYLEKSIQNSPDQWLWIHDRWKQQTIDHVKRIYRYGFILVILPKTAHPTLQEELRSIYPRSFLSFVAPDAQELLKSRDWRYQLVLDFANLAQVRRHFLKLGAVRALYLTQETMKQTLVKPECLHTVSS